MSDEERDEAAEQWLVKLIGATDMDEFERIYAKFEEWLSESPENFARYHEKEHAWCTWADALSADSITH